MHPRHHDEFFRQHWRRAVIPIQGVASEGFNEIRLPENFPGKVQRREIAALKIGDDNFAIGGG